MAEAVRDLVEPGDFWMEFVGLAGAVQREPLPRCWGWRFEDVEPVRPFRWSKGQKHFPGWWWSVTTGRHVGFESWLERDHAMLLDFDSQVSGFASQPFWLHWHDGRRQRRHAPDYFARLVDGSGVVIDVRPDDRIGEHDAVVFALTERACALAGWTYRRVGAPAPIAVANVRWLSRYRHPRCLRSEAADRLLASLTSPRRLREVACEVGDPLAVLPVLFHLLWRQVLVADLSSELMHSGTLVFTAKGPI